MESLSELQRRQMAVAALVKFEASKVKRDEDPRKYREVHKLVQNFIAANPEPVPDSDVDLDDEPMANPEPVPDLDVDLDDEPMAKLADGQIDMSL